MVMSKHFWLCTEWEVEMYWMYSYFFEVNNWFDYQGVNYSHPYILHSIC